MCQIPILTPKWRECTNGVKYLTQVYNVTAIATDQTQTQGYRVRIGRRYQMRQRQRLVFLIFFHNNAKIQEK